MIRWITESLGTAAFNHAKGVDGITIIDVRDLVDKAGNIADAVESKIREGCASLLAGNKTVVCCDYGISRSNSVAVGVLSLHEGIDFLEALKKVQQQTGETEIKLEVLNVVQDAIGTSQQDLSREKTYLLTGGSGFLGKALKDVLGEDARVVAPSSQEVDVAAGSTLLGVWAKEYSADVLVHLANPRVYTSNQAIGSMLTMLQNAIDVCLAEDIPLVYMSSWEVFSNYVGFVTADESLPLNPFGPYGAGKMLSENLIEHMRQTSGLKCLLIRCGPIYGIGSNRPYFLYNFIDKVKNGKDIVTHCYQTGLPGLDLLYIDDAVSALKTVMASGFYGNLHIGTGQVASTKRIAEKINSIMGGGSKVFTKDIAAPTAVVAMDYSLAKKEFGWEPTVTIDEGLKRIIMDIKDSE